MRAAGRRLAVAATLVALLAAVAAPVVAGDRCTSHFPELRAFVAVAGSRATPDEATARSLTDELSIERALWTDEANRHRARLAEHGAAAGLARLDAIDAELAAVFARLEAALAARGPLDEGAVGRLLACADDTAGWTIRSTGPAIEDGPASRREPVVAAQPPDGYHEPPSGPALAVLKADPDDVWPTDPLHPVVAKAAELGHDPVAIYRFVLNEIRAEHTFGLLKSPAVVLASKCGNDADQALLLTELLRASGYPARLARGVVELPTARLLGHFGLADHTALEALLADIGIAWAPAGGGTAPAAYRVERFWCEVWIAYANFRGLELDRSGETWAVLDPELEAREEAPARRVLDEMGFDADAFLASYLAGDWCGPDLEDPFACVDPWTALAAEVDAYLYDLGDPATYASLAEPPAVQADDLPILPASMPGHVVGVSWVGLSPPADAVHHLRLVARDGGLVLLDAELDLAELVGREAALWYAPATADDEQIVAAYDGNLWAVPPYLLNVTPQLIRRGGEVVRGQAGAGMGRPFTLEVTVTTPSGATVGFSNREVTGVPTVIAVAAGDTGYAPVGDSPGSSLELLSALADDHLAQDRRFAAELAALTGLGHGHRRPSVTFVGNQVEIDGALGLVQSLDWQGLFVDVDVRSPRVAGGDGASRRAWRILTHLAASAAERTVFSDFGVTAVSADLALILADSLGVQVLTVDAGNLPTVLPTLPFPAAVLDEIEGWVLAGGTALVPAEAVGLLHWEGVGYLLLSPGDGGARYQLAGELVAEPLGGGSTADPPVEAQQEFGLALWPPTSFPVNTDPTAVVAVRKLDGFDGVEGTVGHDAPAELRVEAIDHHGARVAGVPVLFTSTAGGGELVDDAGALHTTLTVPTDEHGVARVGLRFGPDTSANPVYALREPGDEHVSQALLHLVDAVGQGYDGQGIPVDLPVSEPFWAVAFSDEPVSIRRTDTAATTFVGAVARWSDTMYLAVEDQHGNPVSNVEVSFDVLPLAIVAACTNELPAALRLDAAVFDNLSSSGEPPCGGHPVLGSCGGPSLAKRTSFAGVSAGVIAGNVVGATYTVRAAAPGLPPLGFSYTPSWNLDPITGACDAAERLLVSSSFLADENGRNVNAATPGGLFSWPVELWIDSYEPEPRAGDPPYYAGGGSWIATCGADLGLPVSNGGSATPPILDPVDWSYTTFVTTGVQPGLNRLRVQGSSFTHCATGFAFTTPLDAEVTDVWGVLPEIAGFTPSPVALTGDGRLAEPLTVAYTVEPPDYSARSVVLEVRDLDTESTTLWPGSGRTGPGQATVPRGEPIEPEHDHAATVVLNPAHPAEVRSAAAPVPVSQPIFAELTQWLVVSQQLDVLSRTTCPEHAVFSFVLNHAAAVTLTAVRNTPAGPGAPEVLIDNLVLAAGEHHFTVSPSSATPADLTLLPSEYDLELTGVSQVTGRVEAKSARAVSSYQITDTLPVGHAMVKSVDLLDGHLVISRDDLSVHGRGVPLDFQRTYSSASASPGHLGQGWTHSWLARVVETPCAELLLIGTEGSGMRFTRDGAGGWQPPAGHHGTLVRDGATHEIDYYTTAGIRYRFLPVTTLTGLPTGEWLLDFVEDPSGNRTTLVYEEGGDGLPRVKRVVEPGGRELVFHYEWRIFRYWAGDVLTRVEGPEHLEVRFSYDGRGNLVEARREGDARVERYGYEIVAFRDVLTEVQNLLNGATTLYEYSNEPLGLVGGAADIFLVGRLTEPEGGVTQLFYDTDALAADASTLTTWVRDPRNGGVGTLPTHGNPDPFDTTYTLNRYGSPTAITDPLGHTTHIAWATDDVVMTSRTDANGVTTLFDHDEHGNLLGETVEVTDVDGVVHSYAVVNSYVPPTAFDPPYLKNRVASHTDRNGSSTSFAYDGAGRLLTASIEVTDAVGATSTLTTAHTFDPVNGDRLSTTDPRGHTTTFAYDSLGNLVSSEITVTDIDGGTSVVRTTTAWDVLGRPVSRTDPRGYVTTFGHDTLGRLTSVTHPEVEVDLGVYWRPLEETIYDDASNSVTAIDGNGHATVSVFDAEGRLVRVVNPLGASRTVAYDSAGNKERESTFSDSATQPFFTTYAIDRAGRVYRREEPDGRFTDYAYDGVGNVTVESLYPHGAPPAEARVTSFDRDELHRVIRTTRDPDGLAATISSLLDGEGNVLRATDAEGRVTTHRYDELGRLIETSGPEWRPGSPTTTRFFHDGNGNLERELRLNQRIEARPIVVTDAEGHSSRTRYDLAGNIAEEIDRRGSRISHDHDALNRRTRTTQHLTDPDTGAPWQVVTRRVFDAMGNLRHELQPNGGHVTHVYDAANRLLASSDDIGPLVAFAYDARGNPVVRTDGNGHQDLNIFDPFDRLIRTTRPAVRSEGYTYDVAGNRVQLEDGRGNSTDSHYDLLDRLVLVEYPAVDGVRSTESATYDLVGNRLTATDRNGHTTTFVYDDLDRVVEVRDPPLAGPPAAQYTLTSTYDALGARVAEVDRRGIPSRWVVDREGRTVETHRDGILIAATVYDPAGNPELVTDANGHATRTVYDERNLPVRVERPEQVVETLTRDAMGDVVRSLDGEGTETLHGYDLRRRLASQTNGAGETTVLGYDLADNLTNVRRPLGEAWTWTRVYDAGNRLVRVVDPLGNRTLYEYDQLHNLTATFDANDRAVYYDYDALDRLRAVRYPDGARRDLAYDPNGNLLSATDPKGQTVTSLYDELNREVLRLYSAPAHPVGEVLQSIAFAWDPSSNLLDAVESYAGGTRTTHQEWDRFDRLDRVVDGFGKVLDYGYDLNGNRTSLVDPDGELTAYAYDALNRLDTVTLPGAASPASYTWRRNGLLDRIAYPNGTTAAFAYDDALRLEAVDHLGPGGAPIATFDYAYDLNGNRTLQTESNGGPAETTTYAYDLADRLFRVAYPDRTTTYGFDPVGNRIAERSLDPLGALLDDRLYAYDNRNRLTTVDDLLDPAASIAYAHDLNGNRTRRSQGATVLDLRYDARDQLLEVDVDGSQAWTFSFDYRGLRVAKWGSAGLLNATYDGHALLQQHSALGDPVATFRYGPDRLLAVDHFSQGRALYHHDALGSPIALTDPAGLPLNRSTYDAWGNYRAQSGSHWNPFGFTGHEYDPETGLYYAKARFYDPEVGRFLTEDPAEPDLTNPPSLHRYLYAYGNPTVWVDPDGRESIEVSGDGEVFWVVEKNWVGPINPEARRVLIGHAATEKGLFGNKPSGEVQLLDEFGGGFGVPLGALEKNASLFWGRDSAGSSVLNPSDISEMSPSIQNKLIAGWIDGELNPRREARLSAGSTYMERTREQMLGGGSADEATLLGVSGQLALGVVGADLPMDIRTLKDDITNWERSPDHLMKTVGDVVALPA